MTYLLLQTFLLLLSSYFLGAFVACLVKRTVSAQPRLETVPVYASPQPVQQTALRPAQRPVPAPVAAAIRSAVQAAAPRLVEPVQPKIDILARPEPKPQPKPVDTSRFDRALSGPDPNAGVPRKSIVEIRPAIFKSPTGPAAPWPPPAKPKPPEPVVVKPAPVPVKAPALAQLPKPAGSVPQGTSAATAAAAAAAVAAAKAAATAAAAVTPQIKPSQPWPAPAPAAQPVAAADPQPKAAEAAAQTPAPAPTPAPVTKPAPAAATAGGDDFQRIRAIDAATEQKLKGLGVTRFEDIGRWVAADVTRVNQAIGLDGRVDREQWIEQAQILAKGGETYYSRNRASALKTASVPAPEPAPKPASAAAANVPAPSSSASVASATTAAAAVVKVPVAPPPAAAPQTASQMLAGRSVAEMAAAAAAAIAAASASVTRGVRPIEPISPMTRADPNIVMPAKLSDAIKEKEGATKDKDSKDAAPRVVIPGVLKPAAAGAEPDDLKRIRGIGVLIEKRLNGMRVTSYDQIANWTSGDIDRVSQTLDFKGRIERENWVEQARILSSGGHTEFSRRVDKGDVESSRDE